MEKQKDNVDDSFGVSSNATSTYPNSTFSKPTQETETETESETMSQLKLSTSETQEDEDIFMAESNSESQQKEESPSILLPGLGGSTLTPQKRPQGDDDDSGEASTPSKRTKTDDVVEGDSFDIYGKTQDEGEKTVDEDKAPDDASLEVHEPSIIHVDDDEAAVGDESVEIIDETTKKKPPASPLKFSIPPAATKKPTLDSVNSTSSESLFTKIVPVKNRTSTSSMGTSGEDRADDEASASVTLVTSKDSSALHDKTSSPNISCSPIVDAATSNAGPSKRVSSTPAPKSPRRKVLSRRKEPMKPKTPSSEDENDANTNNKKKKRMSPKKKEDLATIEEDKRFKMPSKCEKENSHFILIGGKSGIDKQDCEKIKTALKDINVQVGEFVVPKNQTENFAAEIEKVSKNFNTAKTPETAQDAARRKLRLSASSSLSHSSSNSGTSGYTADHSSYLSSSSSGGSKRDRYSILPEAVIQPHKVPSPLPGRGKVKRQDKSKDSEVEAAKTDEETLPTTVKKRTRKPSEPKLAPPSAPPAIQRLISTESNVSVESSKSIRSIQEGAIVFAKYVEGLQIRFWPAVVKAKIESAEEKWRVKFSDDEKERELPNVEIIPAVALCPGHPVSVILHDEDEGASLTGVLIAYPDTSRENVIDYHVKFDKVGEDVPQTEEKLVPHVDIFLTAEQAKKIRSDLGGAWATPKASGAAVDLRNVVEGSRVRRKPQSVTPQAKSSTPKRKKGGEHVETSAADTEVELSPHKRGDRKKKNFPASASARKRILDSTSDEEDFQKSATPTRKGKRFAREFQKAELFAGLEFIITKGTRVESNNDLDTTIDTEADDDDTETDTKKDDVDKLNRRQLKLAIEEHGGKVFDEFPGGKRKLPNKSNLYILTDRPRETMTFLLALAYGYPRIHFRWVGDCIRTRKRQPVRNYSVQAGYSTILEENVEPTIDANLTDLLNGKNLLVTSNQKPFVDDWKQILLKLGASVNTRIRGRFDRTMKTIDLVVADSESPAGILEDAKSRNTPVVNSRWIIQCLINGKRVPLDTFLVGP